MIQSGAKVGLQLFLWKIIQRVNDNKLGVSCTHNCKPICAVACISFARPWPGLNHGSNAIRNHACHPPALSEHHEDSTRQQSTFNTKKKLQDQNILNSTLCNPLRLNSSRPCSVINFLPGVYWGYCIERKVHYCEVKLASSPCICSRAKLARCLSRKQAEWAVLFFKGKVSSQAG